LISEKCQQLFAAQQEREQQQCSSGRKIFMPFGIETWVSPSFPFLKKKPFLRIRK